MSVRRPLLLAAALACAGCGRHAPPASPAALAAFVTPAPHFSPVPLAPPFRPAELRELQAKLGDELGVSALATSGIAILDDAGRPLFVRRERTPVAPASTFKLLVAVAALETLGPDYRFDTRFEAVDPPRDGTLDGDLYLVGEGDPSLTSDDLRGGVGALHRAGLTTVTGGIVADASTFGGAEVNPAWDPDDLQYDYAAGASALSLDDGVVEFHIVPGAVGGPARVEVRPPGAVRVLGGVTTGYETTLSIDRAPDRNDFTFDGSIAIDAEQSFYRPVIDQPLYVGQVAEGMLRGRGIDLVTPARVGTAPPGATVLWTHRSAPLRALLATMLFESDNHYAEQLLRAVGAHEGAIGTVHTGAIVERALLKRLGAPADGLQIVDGSGMAASNRISPLTMATLLSRAALDPQSGNVLFYDLPRVGIEGTVARHDLTTALGRARAKSGHIEDVNALAGYVQTRHHGRVSFAIIVNDPDADDDPVYDGMDASLDTLAAQ